MAAATLKNVVVSKQDTLANSGAISYREYTGTYNEHTFSYALREDLDRVSRLFDNFWPYNGTAYAIKDTSR